MIQLERPLPRYAFHAIWLALLLIHIAGLPIEIMEIDAAQYASISREMWEGGSWLQVLHRGENYLDKPPLLFWTSALSMGLFGFNPVAYKLPALLFAILGVFSTYRLVRLYYKPHTAQLAALILASCLYTFKSTNDVRTDTHLMGAVAFASWQLMLWWGNRKWLPLLLGAAGVGVAMLAKGPIGLIVPGAGLFVHILLRHEWKKLLDWRLYTIAPLVIAVVLSPMLMGLWQQWGSEGLYFFFWKQSFGRITGESEWSSDGGFSLFFFYSILWMLLPWTPLFLAGLVTRFRRLRALPEGYSLGAFILPFLALSFSRYKLDHYIYVLFPFAAIMASAFVEALSPKALTRWAGIMLGMGILMAVLGLFVADYFFYEEFRFVAYIVPGIVMSIAYLLFRNYKSGYPSDQFATRAIAGALILGVAMNVSLYPSILCYQASTQAAHYIKHYTSSPKPLLVTYLEHGHLQDFYLGKNVPMLGSLNDLKSLLTENKVVYLYTTHAGITELKQTNLNAKCVSEFRARAEVDLLDFHPIRDIRFFMIKDEACLIFPSFHITRLSGTFLNPNTRARAVSQRYLVRVQLPPASTTDSTLQKP